jgi:hypothetical protein
MLKFIFTVADTTTTETTTTEGSTTTGKKEVHSVHHHRV